MRKRFLFNIGVLGVFCLLVSSAGRSQPSFVGGGSPPAEDASKAEAPPEPSPRSLVSGLLSALAARDYDQVAEFLEAGDYDQSRAELARRLHELINCCAQLSATAQLSDKSAGRLGDGLEPDLERLGTLRAGERELAILARRVEGEDGAARWRLSERTLQALPPPPAIANKVTVKVPLIGTVPEGPELRGAPLAHWLIYIALAAASLAMAWLLTSFRRQMAGLLTRRRDTSRLWRFIEASAPPTRLFVAVLLFTLGAQFLDVAPIARHQLLWLVELAGWFAGAWLLWRVIDAFADATLDVMTRKGRLTAYAAVSFLRRLAKALLVAVIVIVVLGAVGIDITAGLAALGIGGIALALGAQKLVENLVGSLTLIADRPVRVGDFCRFGDTLGTIEDIGMRSTRIRTLERTVITVPNGEFSALHLENFSKRDLFWFHPVLNLRYETGPDQIRYLLEELRAMLYAHPKVDADPARVRFVNLGSHSLDLEIFAYVHAANYNDFLEIQEDLLLRCMDIVAASGTSFAFPSQTLYMARDSGLDGGRRAQSEETVRRRMEEERLQVPRFEEERIAELKDSLDYPPRGSAMHASRRQRSLDLE